MRRCPLAPLCADATSLAPEREGREARGMGAGKEEGRGGQGEEGGQERVFHYASAPAIVARHPKG